MYPAMSSSEEEIALAERLLQVAHCEAAGALNAQAAVDIFGRSGLTYEQLRDIWKLSDRNESGDLSKDELAIAIRLMGWAQAGEQLDPNLLQKAGPLPTLEGINDIRKPGHSPYPPISLEEIRNFKVAFVRAGPIAGLLKTDQAMSAFLSISSLSYEQLLKITKLADMGSRGVLDFAQFALGMYIIHAFQSCLIPSIPNSIPDSLYKKFVDAKFEPPPLHRAQSSLNQPTTPPISGPSTQTFSSNTDDTQEDTWAVLPQERLEADAQFSRLDVEQKGFIGTDTAAKFLMGHDLPPSELGRIWMLADINRDNRLTREEFAIVLHFLRVRLAGEPLPDTLPPALIPPAMRTLETTSSHAVSSVRTPKSPPPVPRKSSITIAPVKSPRASTVSPTIHPRYSMALSPPQSPGPSLHRSTTSLPLSPNILSPSMSFPASPSRPRPPTPTLSPFEDTYQATVSNSSSKSPTPTPSTSPLIDAATFQSLEQTYKTETGRLTLLIESLRSQLSEHGQLREANLNLEKENKLLKAQLRDMERTVSEVLSANDRLGSQEQYVAEIARLTAEVEAKDTAMESMKRTLEVLKREEQGHNASLRDSLAELATSKAEADGLRNTVTTQKTEIEELGGRLADMSKAMSEPSSSTNNRELRVLLRDATKDNESLKSKLRDATKSMEQLLLSNRSTAQVDELQRENRRLKEHIQDMELIAMTVQTSSSSAYSSETLARENQHLKDQIKAEQRAIAQIREAHDAKLIEMQQKVDSLTHENRLLKMDATANQSRSQRPQADNSIPPPAYDDTFVVT